MKLSKTQLNVLIYAAGKPNSDERLDTLEDGWFYPQHTTRGSIDFFCRWQTCASLCGLGLLQYRTWGEPYKVKGRWKQYLEYHITQDGIDFLERSAKGE